MHNPEPNITITPGSIIFYACLPHNDIGLFVSMESRGSKHLRLGPGSHLYIGNFISITWISWGQHSNHYTRIWCNDRWVTCPQCDSTFSGHLALMTIISTRSLPVSPYQRKAWSSATFCMLLQPIGPNSQSALLKEERGGENESMQVPLKQENRTLLRNSNV